MSLFFRDHNSLGELLRQARALGDMPTPLGARAAASWALGWDQRHPSSKPPMPPCGRTQAQHASAHSLEKLSGNPVEESAPLFVDRFEDEDKTNTHIRSAKLNQLVR